MHSEDKPKAPRPDRTQETLLPKHGMKLSTFACTVWVSVLLILIAAAWLVATKFDIGRLRGSEHYVAQARQAVDKKDWEQALAALQKVDGPARAQPAFSRLLADYLIGIRSDPSSLIQVLEKLQTTPLSMPEDGIWLARAYLAGGRPAQARKTLEGVAGQPRASLLYQETLVALLREEGRPRDAAEAENVLFARFASDPGVAVRKAARDLIGTFPEIREAAEKKLWEVATQPGDHAVAAMRVLAGYSGLTLPQARRLQQLAAAPSSLSPAEQLNIASLLLRLDPERREAILQTEIDQFKGAGGETFQQLVAWLAKEKEFGKILRLVPRESLVQSVELFPAVAQDLAQRGQWTDLLELLEKGKSMPVSNARAAGWRALATRNLLPADTRAVRAHLEEAITEGIAKKDHHALSAALTLAEEWNMPDLVLDATLKLAIPGVPNEFALLEKSWQVAFRLKREAVLASLAERMAALKPGSPVLARRNDYFRLLRGEGIETTAGAVIAANAAPADLLLHALKAYRMGDMVLCAAALDGIHSTADMSPGETAIYAGLLAKVRGETARAFQLAEKVRPELLLAQERVFLRMAL